MRGQILFEDDAVLVVNKASGVPCHSASGTESIIDIWRPKYGALWPVHRLDRDTSGVLVLAKTARAATDLGEAFRNRCVSKLYFAVVEGCPADSTIDAPIGRDRRRPQARRVHPTGKAATTRVRVLSSGDGLSGLALAPVTGRTHQLRVHLSHVGHPILGDALYGGMRAARVNDEAVRVERVLLHAAALKVPHWPTWYAEAPAVFGRIFTFPHPSLVEV